MANAAAVDTTNPIAAISKGHRQRAGVRAGAPEPK